MIAPRRPRRLVLLALAAATALGAACDGEAPSPESLDVLASPSLARAADTLAASWGGDPGVDVEILPTPEIVARLKGAESAPDVLLLDDSRDMSALWVAGEIARAYRLGTDRLLLVVAGNDPAGVRGVADLARADVRVALPDTSEPLGRRAREAFVALGIAGPVEANRVGDPRDVRDVLDRVAAGEAHAGLAWASTLTPERRERLRVFPLPEAVSARATLAIGIPNGAERADEARAFVDFALSAKGREALAGVGLGPP